MITLRPLPFEFSFAGFSFPRYVADLPVSVPRYTYGDTASDMMRVKLSTLTNSLRARRASRQSVGPYYVSPKPDDKRRSVGFYCADDAGTLIMGDGAISLRVEYAEGEYTDPEGDSTFYAIVARLPKSRGFLAGWTMGPGMCASLDTKAFDSLRDAQIAADNLAESAVWEESQYQANYRAAEALRNDIDDLIAQVRENRELVGVYVMARKSSQVESVTMKLTRKLQTIRTDTHSIVDRVRVLRERYDDNFARMGV